MVCKCPNGIASAYSGRMPGCRAGPPANPSRYGRSLDGGPWIINSELSVQFNPLGASARIYSHIFRAFEAIEYPESSSRVPMDSNVRMFVLTHRIDRSTRTLSYVAVGLQEYWLFERCTTPAGRYRQTVGATLLSFPEVLEAIVVRK